MRSSIISLPRYLEIFANFSIASGIFRCFMAVACWLSVISGLMLWYFLFHDYRTCNYCTWDLFQYDCVSFIFLGISALIFTFPVFFNILRNGFITRSSPSAGLRCEIMGDSNHFRNHFCYGTRNAHTARSRSQNVLDGLGSTMGIYFTWIGRKFLGNDVHQLVLNRDRVRVYRNILDHDDHRNKRNQKTQSSGQAT